MKPSEPLHSVALARVLRINAGDDEIVVPAIFRIEVESALARGRVPDSIITSYVEELLATAEVVTIGPKTAQKIGRLAVKTRLRAADAAYAWVASREALPLITSDGEMMKRTRGLCVVSLP